MLNFWKFKWSQYMCYEDGIGVVEMILLLVEKYFISYSL